ncbi:ankyrin repeat-containing domain protein [Mycena pura]|uniref:protein S-acyltransferase n=1 Tax=Mycena pura TaxID=153505 RepID=A0AAD6YB39_9AGAR|nr:ankyrin repeat-containing domain protein [Mycena pura]
MSLVSPCIPSDPDIFGIGVRIAIYTQNLLSFIPVIGVLRDREVSVYELQSVETQSTTILITAFAILTSAMVETRTIGLSANIILSLSWMNNTNTFIYLLLYVQHRSQAGPANISLDWTSWIRHIEGELGSLSLAFRLEKREKPLTSVSQSPVHSVFKRIVFILRSLHLSMMAALGIWLWSHPRSFATSPFYDIPLRSSTLRVLSLVIYSLFLAPGLNLVIPTVLFLTIFIVCRRWHSEQRDSLQTFPAPPSIFPAVVGTVILCVINLVFLIDIELTLHHNRVRQGSSESTWSFGQILAMLLLVLPMRDVWNATIARGHTTSLQEALRKDAPTEDILHSVTQPGADVNTRVRDSKHTTVLQLAVSRQDVTLVALLLRLGAEPNSLLGNKETVLQGASATGNLDVVKILLEHGADPNIRGDHYGTALQAAWDAGHLDTFRLLLERGADPNIRYIRRGIHGHPVDFETALYVAAYDKNLDVIKLLLEHEADPNIRCIHGSAVGFETALHVAACDGNTNIIKVLLEHGADPNIHSDHYGTALQAAWDAGHLETSRLLLERGADPNIRYIRKGIHGEMISGPASCDGNMDILKLLLDHGADPNIHSNQYGTALQAASDSGQRDIFMFLLEHGADPNIRYIRMGIQGGLDGTALYAAAHREHLNIVTLLLEHGADPNIPVQGPHHGTPLYRAAYCGHLQIVELLLQYKANPMIQDQGGEYKTALRAALEKGQVDVVRCLKAHLGLPNSVRLLVDSDSEDIYLEGEDADLWAYITKSRRSW